MLNVNIKFVYKVKNHHTYANLRELRIQWNYSFLNLYISIPFCIVFSS